MKKIIFTTLGFPGSGKTYFSRKLARDLGLIHLNSDKIRSEMFKKPVYSFAENKKFFKKMDSLAGKYLKEGRGVIYDANLTRRKFRSKLKKMADKYGARYVLLRFRVSVPVALKRIARRSKYRSELMKKYYININKSVLSRIKKEIEEPTRREAVMAVDASKPYKEQVRALMKFLSVR